MLMPTGVMTRGDVNIAAKPRRKLPSARYSGSTRAAICVSTEMQNRQRSGGPLREVIDRGYDIDLRDRRVYSNRWNLLPADAVIAKNAFRYAGERMQRFFIAAPVPHSVGDGLEDGLARATDASSPCRATGRPRKYSQIDSPPTANEGG
jgi:hypothetical protein